MKALADTFSLEVVQIVSFPQRGRAFIAQVPVGLADVTQKIVQVLKIHENDPNFPQRTIEKLKCFMSMGHREAVNPRRNN